MHAPPCWNVSIDGSNAVQVERYLKRQQRALGSSASLADLAETAAMCARQNATIDMFETYFDDDDGESLAEELNPRMLPVATLRFEPFD